jgi:ribulose-phosphate 3-epimerase
MKLIIPAIYALDIDEFNKKLSGVLGFADLIQIDIMDGAFVEEESFELIDLKELPSGKMFELHLMVAYPREYLSHITRLGIKKVIFHDEIEEETEDVIDTFKKEGLEVFVALNPETEPAKIEYLAPKIDGVMLMSVEPGRGGQEFIPATLEKARYIRSKYPELVLEIDGGVNKGNLKEVFDSGVNIAAIGSGILKAENPEKEWDELQEISKL